MPLSFTSAKIGLRPKFNTQLAEIMKDLGVTIILSFFFRSNDFKAISRAILPFETAIEYLFPICLENSNSKFLHSFPVQ